MSVSKVSIPTYTEPEREELPMFAENRVHQRSSGNPYPNKIVLKVNREQKVDKEYLSFYSILTQRTDAAEARSIPVKLRFALL